MEPTAISLPGLTHFSLAKLLIVLCHVSGMLLATHILKLFRDCKMSLSSPVYIMSKQLVHESIAWFLWNLVVVVVFWAEVNGVPLSPAGFILWPSIVIWFNMRLYTKYQALLDSGDLQPIKHE